MYTTFAYDPISSQQIVQIVLEDTTFVTNASGQHYHPGKDPSVPVPPIRQIWLTFNLRFPLMAIQLLMYDEQMMVIWVFMQCQLRKG